jgi:molybdopterin synthase catalytic subunit
VVTFQGRVRNKNNDRDVTALTHSAYPELAERVAERICEEACDRFAIRDMAIAQRTGQLEVTVCSIRVAVSAGHRKAAFEAGEWVIDEVKERLPVWKNEQYTDGTTAWINRPDPGGTPCLACPVQCTDPHPGFVHRHAGPDRWCAGPS